MTDDPHQKALQLAFRALNARDRSVHEMRTFLERRAVEPEVIGEVVETLVAEGLLDDVGYARRLADDRRLLGQWGNERIARDLVRRGIERELIDQALAGHDREDELAVAIELLDRRFPLPFDTDRDRDKAWRMLVRRGYEAELAYSAVRRHEQGLRNAA